jgi:hypothetical protein
VVGSVDVAVDFGWVRDAFFAVDVLEVLARLVGYIDRKSVESGGL